MIHRITIEQFFTLEQTVPLVDVRTPAEFSQGHVPGAYNIPLFTNEERVQVGTTYKQISREAAILLGFDLTGNKWSGFIRQALELAPQKKIAVHCWRGGMRSGAMAWAFDLYGFEVYVIEGGYKSFRTQAIHSFAEPYKLIILGGRTGSGKTRILHQLQQMGEQVIDLEELAQHQGSSYGSMNRMTQPTQEQFENNLSEQLRQIQRARRIWVEDESSAVGKRVIPRPFWNQMVNSAIIDVLVPAEQRIETLVQEYGFLDKDFLIESTLRIGKRLGPAQTKDAIAAISENRMADFIKLVIVYYDKTYRTGLAKRKQENIYSIAIPDNNHALTAGKILELVQAHNELS